MVDIPELASELTGFVLLCAIVKDWGHLPRNGAAPPIFQAETLQHLDHKVLSPVHCVHSVDHDGALRDENWVFSGVAPTKG